MEVLNRIIKKITKTLDCLYFMCSSSIMEHNLKKYGLEMEKTYSENNLMLDEYSAKLLEKMDTTELLKVFINSKDIDLVELEDKVINSRNAKYIYHFALKIKGAPSEKLTWAICRTRNGEYIYKYATKFSNVNIVKIFIALAELEDYRYALYLAKQRTKEVYPYFDKWGKNLCHMNNFEGIVECIYENFIMSTSTYEEMFRRICESKDARCIYRIIRYFTSFALEMNYFENKDKSFYAKKLLESMCETKDAWYISQCIFYFSETLRVTAFREFALNKLVTTLCEIKDTESIVKVCIFLVDSARKGNFHIQFSWINQLIDSLCLIKNAESITECYHYIFYARDWKNKEFKFDLLDKLINALCKIKDEQYLGFLFNDYWISIERKSLNENDSKLQQKIFEHLKKITICFCELKKYGLIHQRLIDFIDKYKNYCRMDRYKNGKFFSYRTPTIYYYNYSLYCLIKSIMKEVLMLKDDDELCELKNILLNGCSENEVEELLGFAKMELEEDLKIANMNNDELFSKLLDFHNQERIEDIKQNHDFFSKIFISDEQSGHNLKRERKIKANQ